MSIEGLNYNTNTIPMESGSIQWVKSSDKEAKYWC